MKWSEKTWKAITPVYREIEMLPFITELMNGTLEKEKFLFYIRQDAMYISDFGKILTAIATKLTKSAHIEAFIGFAGESIAAESALHQSYYSEFDGSKPLKQSPACLLYTSYLYRQLSAPVEIMAAAVLPCFWIYKEVGDYILANRSKENNPYQAWIDMYSSEEFARSVEKAIRICDELADQCTDEQQQAMTDVFVACSKFEWMFWDSAYRLEQWRI
jgi:thiaminase/transcriptional activator TenA